jgi:sigma-E factor negative regulatory protein RseA
MSNKISTDQFGEQLSFLMDGELPRDQLRFLLRRIDTDAELVQRWSRYQIVRHSLRRQAMPALRVDFADVLMQRIAHEVLPVASRRGASLLRWAGGGAIAAAVAVVALVATRPQVQNTPAMPSVAAVAPAPTAQDARPAQTVLPPLANFDYAQPASFDTGAGFYTGAMPRYDFRRRYETTPAGNVYGFAPYLLPLRPQQGATNNAETPQP